MDMFGPLLTCVLIQKVNNFVSLFLNGFNFIMTKWSFFVMMNFILSKVRVIVGIDLDDPKT